LGFQLEYQVIARKFRPKNFEEVAGQEHVVRTLRNAIAQGRVAHAFLFSGPRGVGKTSVARILAKALNCEKGPTPTPCNVCSNCVGITAGASLDVHEIDGASNRGIDEIRELRENVKFAPASSRYKIYIIDEVHMLTDPAFNALLKTLEEPPAHVIYIFATTEIHKVPATILSRCQCYDFRRISLKEITANLGLVAQKEGIKISPSALSWIAEAGDGSMRDAQSVFDQVISYAGFDIRDEDVEECLGLSNRKYLFRLSEAVLQRNAGACLSILEEAYLAGVDMMLLYQMLLKHFRNLLLVKIAGEDSASFDIAPEQIAQIKNQIRDVSRENLQRYLEILMTEEGGVRRTQQPRMKLETILVQMAYLEPMIPIGEIISTIEQLEQKLQGNPGGSLPLREGRDESGAKRDGISGEPGSALAREKEAADVEGRADSLNLKSLSEDFKKFVKKENALLGAKIDSAKIARYEGNCLTLDFPKNHLFLEDVRTSQLEKLKQIAGKFFQKKVTVAIEASGEENDGAAGNNEKSKTNSVGEIKREAMHHPLLQKIMDELPDARVVDIQVKTNNK
jgi:DNA polymerase-3 subunit gamma/tau